MNLYEIDAALVEALEKGYYEEFINEDGEFDEEGFTAYLNELKMAQDAKLENLACFIKNIEAEAKAIKDEEAALAARRKAKELKAQRLKDYLQGFMQFKELNSFESARCKVSFRRSTKLVLDDEAKVWAWATVHDDYLRYKEPELRKDAITKALKSGEKIEGCRLAETRNLQLK